jgi:hypothetical protein
MRQSKYEWGYNDLHRLYQGFGFKFREGGGHTVYYHPVYPSLIATVARHRSLAVGYVQTAVKLVDELQRLQGEQK